MEEEKFYKKGLNFECQRCSFCCGHSPGVVYLSKRDLDALCSFFNMKYSEFVQKYCRWVNYYYGKTVLALQEQKNYDCILWNKGCSAYTARPVQCSTWPFWTWIVKSKKDWEECGAECPGINKGRLWSVEEIEKNLKNYESNTPLLKEEVEELIQDE